MTYEIGLIFVDDKDYSNKAQFCNENGLIIKEIEPNEEGVRQFQICEIPAPSEEELLERELSTELRTYEEKLADIKDRLAFAILLDDTDLIAELKQEYMELLKYGKS